MNPKKFLRLALLLLAIPLAGAKAEDIVGCGGCGGGGAKGEGTSTTPEGELPGGGSIAASKTYSMDRSGLGTSTQTLKSSDEKYETTSTAGGYLSQVKTISDKYTVQHQMSKSVATSTAAAALKKDEEPPPE